MDGIHDLGGKYGFGAIVCEDNEPVFHDRWEAKVFAMMRAAGGAGAFCNGDQFRHAIERIDPVAYLTHGYYGRWVGGLETLLVEAGLVDEEDLERRVLATGGAADALVAARPGKSPDLVDYDNDDGSATISFGYFNRNTLNDGVVMVPLGESNRIEPAQFDGMQPTFLKTAGSLVHLQ